MSQDKIKPNSDRQSVVDYSYPWIEIDENTPQGMKVQLINKHQGVGVYGVYTTQNKGNWTHWAPMPYFKKDQNGE